MPINTQSEIAEYKNEKNKKIPLMQELRDEEIILEDMGIERENYKGRTVGIISRTNDPSLSLKPLFAHRLKRVQDKFGEDSNFTRIFNEFNEDESSFAYLLGIYYKNKREKYDALDNAYKIFEELEVDVVVLDNVEIGEYCYEIPSIDKSIDLNFKVRAMLGSNVLEEKYFTKTVDPLTPEKKEMAGVGSKNDPFVITKFEHLKIIGRNKRYSLSDHYILGNDIDASESIRNRWSPIGDFYPKDKDSSVELTKNAFKISEVNPELVEKKNNKLNFKLSHKTKKEYKTFEVYKNDEPISNSNISLTQKEENTILSIKNTYYDEVDTILVKYITYEKADYTNDKLEIEEKKLCQAILSDDSQCDNFAQVPISDPKYCGVHYSNLDTNYNNKGFRGVFDGNGYKIKNLFINYSRRKKSGVSGVFALNNGTIKNLKIENSATIGSSSLSFISGINNGEIINCSIENCFIKSNNGTSGGISVINNGVIKECKSDCKIQKYKNLGGIAAINKSTGLIENSYSTSNIEGQNSGILVSVNEGEIKNSYVIGDIKGNKDVKNGLFCYENNNIIKNSYSKNISKYDLDFCYKNNKDLENSSVEELETLTDSDNYENWNFKNIWGINDENPYLRWKDKEFNEVSKDSNKNKKETIHQLTSKNIEKYFKNNYTNKNIPLSINKEDKFYNRANESKNIEISNDKITIKNYKREGFYEIEKIYASKLHKNHEDNLIKSFHLNIKGDYLPNSIEKTIEVKYTTNRLNDYHKIPNHKIINTEKIDISSAKYVEFKIKLINYDNTNRPPTIEEINFDFSIQTKADVRYSIEGGNKYVNFYTSPKGNYPVKANISTNLYEKDNRYRKYFIKQLAKYCKNTNSIGLVKAPLKKDETKNDYYNKLVNKIKEVKNELKEDGKDLGRYVGVVLGDGNFYNDIDNSTYSRSALVSSSALFQKYNIKNSPTNKNIEKIEETTIANEFSRKEIKNLTNAGYTVICKSKRNGIVPYKFRSLEEDFDLYKNINTRRIVNYIAKKVQNVTYKYIGKGSNYPFERKISNDIEDVMEEEMEETIQDYNFEFNELKKESIKLNLQLQIIGEVEPAEVVVKN